MNKNWLIVLTLFACLTGCASTPQLSSDDRSHLGTLRIDPTIETQSQMYYLGPGSGIGFLFGAVGGAITAVANLSPGEQFKKFAQDNGINIDQIVKEEATKAFRESGKLKLTDTSDPNVSTLKISIPMYGFSIPNGFSSKLVPIVGIKCTLVDPSGKTIWSARESTHPLGNPADGRTIDEFKSNPKEIEDSWRIAAKSVMGDIVGNM
ncbi:MAG: hypothetical protein ACLPXB_03045 [Thiobacillaceae bacterium]